jgi:F-type H+-transporting ATPase subunit epsilon
MAGNGLKCSVITPEGKAFEGPAEEVVIPAHDGEIGILHNHAPLLCKLGSGLLRVAENSTMVRLFIEGGFCQVVENRVTVLTQSALKPEQLDRQQAERQLEEAKHLPARDEIDAKRKVEMDRSARAKLRVIEKLTQS